MRQYDSYCEVVHGGYAGPLVKIRPLNATDATSGKLVSGRCVTINSNGEFIAGNGGNKRAMPLFLLLGTNMPSVWNSGTVSGVTKWVAMHGRGEGAVAVVATGGFEVQTTEFDTTRSYSVNDALTADNNGVLTNQSVTWGTSWIVGICSVHENAENISPPFVSGQPPRGRNVSQRETLTFWTYFYPGSAS